MMSKSILIEVSFFKDYVEGKGALEWLGSPYIREYLQNSIVSLVGNDIV